jgi:phage N-6-adenine-methyltransferase
MSNQNWGTPPEFIAVFEKRFGPIVRDLAASPHNAVAPRYWTENDDALKQDWHAVATGPTGWLWLNPPFEKMAPWAEKCRLEACKGARVAMLCKASVGANWFHTHVFPAADVEFLAPRIRFVGAPHVAPFDCALCLFTPETVASVPGGVNRVVRPWRWDQ